MGVFKANTAAPGSHIWKPICVWVSICVSMCVSVRVAENEGMIRVKHYELRSHLQLRVCDLCSLGLLCHWLITWTDSNRCKLILWRAISQMRCSEFAIKHEQETPLSQQWHVNMTSPFKIPLRSASTLPNPPPNISHSVQHLISTTNRC